MHTNGDALPGVYQIITILDERAIPLAVASSSAPPLIEAVLKKLGLAEHIQLAYSAVHEEFGKPHPAVFLTTAQKLGVNPEDCLVFEDSVSGVQAAKAAGMKCIAVPEEANRTRQEFGIADKVVDSLEDVNWEMMVNLWA